MSGSKTLKAQRPCHRTRLGVRDVAGKRAKGRCAANKGSWQNNEPASIPANVLFPATFSN